MIAAMTAAGLVHYWRPRPHPKPHAAAVGAPPPRWHRTTMVVTAYNLTPAQTGKSESSPDFGLTASGLPAVPNYTVAAPEWMPFGTVLKIKGVFHPWVVEDRGGGIHGNHLDILLPTVQQAWNWGRRVVVVHWRVPKKRRG